MVNLLTKLASPSLRSKASFKLRMAEMRSRLAKRPSQHIQQTPQTPTKTRSDLIEVDSGLVDSELFLTTTTAADESTISVEMVPFADNRLSQHSTHASSSRTSTPIFNKSAYKCSSHGHRNTPRQSVEKTRTPTTRATKLSAKHSDLNYFSLGKNNEYNYSTGVLLNGADLFYGEELNRFQGFGGLKVWLV